MQYHYVGLDKLPVCGGSVQQSGGVQLVCQSNQVPILRMPQ